MKLITLNTWGKSGPYQKRWNYLLETLQTLKPDVLCLQEVADDELTQLLQKTFQFKHHAAAYSAGLLLISKLPLSENLTIDYQHVSPSEKNYERKAVMTKVKVGNQNLIIANTHLAWRAEDRSVRNGQISELLKAVKKTGFPALICGDLNDIPESSILEETRLAEYENLLQAFQPEAITWDNRNPFIQSHSVRFPDRQVDYILIHNLAARILKTKDCVVTFDRHNQESIYPSDHYGIVAEFEVL